MAQLEEVTGFNFEENDVESLLSIEDKPSNDTVCYLEGWQTETETASSQSDGIYDIQAIDEENAVINPGLKPDDPTVEDHLPIIAAFETAPHVKIQECEQKRLARLEERLNEVHGMIFIRLKIMTSKFLKFQCLWKNIAIPMSLSALHDCTKN